MIYQEDISEEIRELNNKKNIKLQDMRNKEQLTEKINNNNCKIIYSLKPGVGK